MRGEGGKPWMSDYGHDHYKAGIEATKLGTVRFFTPRD